MSVAEQGGIPFPQRLPQTITLNRAPAKSNNIYSLVTDAAATQFSLQDVPNEPTSTVKNIADLGNGFGKAYELEQAKKREGIWAEPITNEQAQMYARQWRFYNELGLIVNDIVEARLVQARGTDIPQKDELKASIIDTIYGGVIPGIPTDLIYSHNTNFTGLMSQRERDANIRLITDKMPEIIRKWEKCKKGPDISAKQRWADATGTTFNILVGKQSATDVYRAIGYSPTQITRIQDVRHRSVPANFAMLALSDQGTSAVGIATGHTINYDAIPDPAKYALFVAAFAGYYTQLALTVDKARKLMENDPDITPSYSAYTAFPIIQRLFSEEEVRAKQITFAGAYLGLNPYEVAKEVMWDTYPLWTNRWLETRIGGDLSAIAILAAQQHGVFPHLETAWHKINGIPKKLAKYKK